MMLRPHRNQFINSTPVEDEKVADLLDYTIESYDLSVETVQETSEAQSSEPCSCEDAQQPVQSSSQGEEPQQDAVCNTDQSEYCIINI